MHAEQSFAASRISRQSPPPIRPSRITIPEHAHPLVRFIFSEMKRQSITYVQMADRSGLSRESLTAWRRRNTPDISSLEATLGVLGFRLADMIEPTPKSAEEQAEDSLIRQRIAAAQRRGSEQQQRKAYRAAAAMIGRNGGPALSMEAGR